MLPSLSLVLLAFNEEKNIGKCIKSAVGIAKKVARKYEVLVVYYEGSKDNTLKIAKEMAAENKKIRIVYQPADKKGYGVALRMGIEAAKYDYVFYTDADNQFDLSELPLLLPYLDSFDIVSGYRMKRMDPFGRVLSAKIYNLLLRVLFGLKMRDVDSAFKIYRRSIFSKFQLRSVTGLIDAEILIRAKNHGLRIKEVPVHHYLRLSGTSNYGTGFIKPSVVINLFKEMLVLWKELRGKE